MTNKSKLPPAIPAAIHEQLPKPAGRFARIILDRWFKRTFGEESRKRLLELLLKELIPEREIESLTYVRDEHINAFDDGHDGRIDVECTDKDGSRFMVEMQVRPQSSFYDRAVLYSALGIQQQVERGIDEYWLKPMYFIGLMDFSMHENSDQVLWRYSIRNDQDNEELMTDHLHYIFLELPNCKNALTEKATILDN
ncbi:MAG: Rpn family recombination-promoting nuclease/putative transposase, partial [Bacteroidales bacterium]|nr:Rpn family recombination-promoting nuclease/putative transposase [Bacteroidales bacterium]